MQPLCFSCKKHYDVDSYCNTCRFADAYGCIQDKCYCDDLTFVIEDFVFCKVSIINPAPTPDLTTFYVDLYARKNCPENQIPDTDEIKLGDSDVVPTISFALDGNLLDKDYLKWLKEIDLDFEEIGWNFKGKASKNSYILHFKKLLDDAMKSFVEVVNENPHVGKRGKKGKKAKK